MKLKSLIVILLIILSSFGLLLGLGFDDQSTVSGASILYVGSSSTYTTIQSAVNAAVPGDTIIVENGSYAEAVTLNKTGIELRGNSSIDCSIVYHYDGSHPRNDFGAAVNVTESGVLISGFNITITGNYSYGIFLNSSITGTQINDIRISTSDTGSFGLVFNHSADTVLSNTVVNTTGTASFGIYLEEANGTIVERCTFATIGTNSHGMLVNRTVMTVINSTLLSSNGVDINVDNDGNVTSINSSFSSVDVEGNGGAVLQVKNYLQINTFYDDATTPIPGADICVLDNGNQSYATAGYGGTDSPTNLNGTALNIAVTDRWYFYSNTAVENSTDVKVKKIVDGFWEENRTGVNMGSSRLEIFVSSDIIAPSKPINLSVSLVPGKNELNVSWSKNTDDTLIYSIYSNRSGTWDFIQNVSFDNSYYLDNFSFIHLIRYYYQISGWDEVPLESQWSNHSYVDFIDDLIPQTPAGLSVTPILNGDALNVSWFPNNNNGDTEMYSIYSNKTGSWELVQNKTHPNSFFFDNSNLVHGERYYYRISAWDEVPQESILSSPVSTVHEDQQKPFAPVNFTAGNSTGTSIELTWTQNTEPDLVGYHIYINVSGARTGGPFINLTVVNATSDRFIVGNLTEETTYYFVIQAFDEVPLFSDFSAEASNSTLDATPPPAPLLAYLPEYTNDTKLLIHGTTEANATVQILRNDANTGEVQADQDGVFDKEITLVPGENRITGYAVDTSGNPSAMAAVQSVVLDTVRPVAEAGPDFLNGRGADIEFNGSLSHDADSGIMNYTWRFNYNNLTYRIYGELAYFTFDYTGNYSVVMRVVDFAGNWDEDTVWVNITTELLDKFPPEIILEKLYPPVDGTNIPIKSIILIPFNEHVNVSTLFLNLSAVASQVTNQDGDGNSSTVITYDIVPCTTIYDSENHTLDCTPVRTLIFNLTYTVNMTIADLAGNPRDFKWGFTTVQKPVIPPDTTPPEPDTAEFYSLNNRLAVNGQITIPFSEQLNESTISVTITDSSGKEIAGNVTYDPEIMTIVFTPNETLKYNEKYTVLIDAEDRAGNPIPEDSRVLTFVTEKGSDSEVLSPFLMWLMLAVIVIVIILIVVVLALQKRRDATLEELDAEGGALEDDDDFETVSAVDDKAGGPIPEIDRKPASEILDEDIDLSEFEE